MLVRGQADWLSSSQIKRARPAYNRIINSPAWKIVAARKNIFEMEYFALHIAKGEIIADPETFLWYLFDRYGEYGQVTLKTVSEHAECLRWRYEELVCWLNGLSVEYPGIIHFSPANGLCVISLYRNKKEITGRRTA
jgi:hypothetical protein